jgi:hypothetical protein
MGQSTSDLDTVMPRGEMSEKEETTILEEGDVKVTNLRVIIGSKTYAMSNIASVSLTTKESISLFTIEIILFGYFVLLYFVIGVVADSTGGLICCSIAITIPLVIVLFHIIKKTRTSYVVTIISGSSVSNIYESQDEAFIKRIVAAMNYVVVCKDSS